jgi:hypothetical protein
MKLSCERREIHVFKEGERCVVVVLLLHVKLILPITLPYNPMYARSP